MRFANRFRSTNGDAVVNMDFDYQINRDIVVIPGQRYGEISVNISDDTFPEKNETFRITMTTSDNVTTINDGSTTVTIQNNGTSNKHILLT